MTYECRSSGSKSKYFALPRDVCDQEVMQALKRFSADLNRWDSQRVMDEGFLEH
jgi:hypothetical protein